VTSSDKITLPEDTSHRFLVRELKISGNKLITTNELLDALPTAYIVTIQQDDEPEKQIYDFRVLPDVMRYSETSHEVSLKTIQGLTRYI